MWCRNGNLRLHSSPNFGRTLDPCGVSRLAVHQGHGLSKAGYRVTIPRKQMSYQVLEIRSNILKLQVDSQCVWVYGGGGGEGESERY